MQNFFFWGGGNAKILRKKYGREIMNYDLIKLLMLRSQGREFHKFFVQLIVADMVSAEFFFREIIFIQISRKQFVSFSHFSPNSVS